MPFAADCERRENGMVTAVPNLPPRDPPYPDISRECKAQLDSNGVACISLPYEVTLKDGTRGKRDKDSIGRGPFDLPAAHIFKIGADGKVHEIEAMGFIADFNAPSGWDN